MQQNKTVVLKVEIEDAIVSGTKFPNAIINMLRNVFGKPRTILLQQINIHNQLLELDASIFAGIPFGTKLFQKIADI